MLIRFAALVFSATLALAATPVRSLPLTFEKNMGQGDASTIFLARGAGYSILFQHQGVAFVRGESLVRMDFGAGAGSARIRGFQAQTGRANYLVGSQDRWITGIPLYGGVRYENVYPGISIIFYATGGELEYDFALAPGAQASAIKLLF